MLWAILAREAGRHTSVLYQLPILVWVRACCWAGRDREGGIYTYPISFPKWKVLVTG